MKNKIFLPYHENLFVTVDSPFLKFSDDINIFPKFVNDYLAIESLQGMDHLKGDRFDYILYRNVKSCNIFFICQLIKTGLYDKYQEMLKECYSD